MSPQRSAMRRLPWRTRPRTSWDITANFRIVLLGVLVLVALIAHDIDLVRNGGSGADYVVTGIANVVAALVLLTGVVYLRRPARHGDGAPVRRSRGHRSATDHALADRE